MDNTKFVGKYLEQDKIKFVSDIDEKTYKGKDMIRLIFENDKNKDLPVEVANYLISDSPIDATHFRDLVVKPLVGEIIGVLLERQIKIDDMDFLFLKINESINLSIQVASDKLWGKDSSEKTLADVDRILTKPNKKDDRQQRRTKAKSSDKIG